jgi:predicted esterase
MAIFGYSQGAQVASDTLCGRSDKDFGGMNTAALTGPAADMSTHNALLPAAVTLIRSHSHRDNPLLRSRLRPSSATLQYW